jgi:TonB family protein
MSYWAELMLLWSGQSLAMIGTLWIAFAVVRVRSAAERYRLWLAGLIVIAVLPAANVFVRTFSVALPAEAPLRHLTQLPEPLTPVPPIVAPSAEVRPAAPSRRPDPMPILFGLWVAGVLISIYEPLRSYLKFRRLRATALIASGLPLRVPVGYSTEVRAPMLAGIFRPMILLPADIKTWADPEEQRAMMLHEAAHFERRDHLLNAFQTLLGAVLFFHPAVRYALRQLTVERELACDERVLAAGARAEAYAETLLKAAERSIAGREGCQPAFNTSGKILDRRMTMILNYPASSLNSSRVSQFLRAAIVCGLAFALLPERGIVSETPLSIPVLVAGVPVISLAQQTTTTSAPAAVAQAIPPAAVQPPAQIQTGSLSGTVYDPTGAVLPGVTVRIFNRSGGVDRTAVTNDRGGYALPQINAGDYTFEVRLPGFANHTRTILIRAQPEVQDAVLQVGRAMTFVEVSVEAPQTPAASPAPSPSPLRVGGVISAPNLISQPKPAYPPGARAKLAQDVVLLDAVVATDGSVQSIQVNPSGGNSNLELIHAAIEAAKQWRYRPALLNGTPIEFPLTISVSFKMQ